MLRAFELDSLNASVVFNVGHIESFDGQLESALEKLQAAADLGLFAGSGIMKGMVLVFAGDLEGAEPLLRERGDLAAGADPEWVDEFLAVMRNPALRKEKEEAINSMLIPADGFLRFSVLVAMESPLVLDVISANCAEMTNAIDLWRSSSAIRRHPDFENAMISSGAMDLWRHRGWPDLCHENDAGELECN
jgi:hypothetical protein